MKCDHEILTASRFPFDVCTCK